MGAKKTATRARPRKNASGVDPRIRQLLGQLRTDLELAPVVAAYEKERVGALIEKGLGKPFDPGHGRLMKGWLTVTSAKASWIELSKEAFAFVSIGGSSWES